MATAEATGTGISFALTEEQKALRELAHEFAAREIRPVAAEYDEHQTHPADVLAKAHEVGLMNPHVPEELGGAALGAMDGALIGEELCWGCSGIGTSIVANILGALPLLIAGTEEQRREWLPPLLEEPILCSFALTEPNAGSDVSGIQTTAVRRADEYVINGSKMFITNAGQASWVIVFASTDKDAGHRGLSAFIVPTELDGVVVEKHLDKMGQRATDTSALAFQDVVVPAANRLGEEGQGFTYLVSNLAQERLSIAVTGVASARQALAWTLDYVKERKAFGQPIGSFQNSKFVLADVRTEVEVSQAYVDACITALNAGTLTADEAAMAKVWCTELQKRVVDRCLQLFGGYGYMLEYPIARAYADARITTIYGGTSEIMKEIVARAMGL